MLITLGFQLKILFSRLVVLKVIYSGKALKSIMHQKFTLKYIKIYDYDYNFYKIYFTDIYFYRYYFFRIITIVLDQHTADKKYHHSIKCNLQQCKLSTIMNQMFETETLMETQAGNLRMNLIVISTIFGNHCWDKFWYNHY